MKGKKGRDQHLDVDALIEEVKAKQRSEPGFREAWQGYCLAYGGNKMDPAKHGPDFIRDALKSISGGVVGVGVGGGGGKKGGKGDKGHHGGKGGKLPNNMDELVNMVKEKQRMLQGWKNAWWHYCDCHGGGDKDPARHDVAFLKQALTVLANPTDDEYLMPHDIGARELEKQGLVNEVKNRQRYMEGFRQYWVEFCHSNGSGGMDPNRYDVEFLRRGLLPPSVNHSELVETIKSYQRYNPQFKTEWVAYCNSRGMGVRDPTRHSPEFLTVALRELTGGKGLKGGKVGGKGYSGGGHMGNRSYTNHHPQPELVDTIKSIQRDNPEARQRWIDFCGRWGSSDLDPTRHDSDFLSRAIKFIQSKSDKTDSTDLSEMWNKLQNALVHTPAKEDLVAAIKRGQRASNEWRSRWWDYCDKRGNGDHDPSRHPASFLQEAMQALGEP